MNDYHVSNVCSWPSAHSKETGLEFFDTYDKLDPCYDIEPIEKITDPVGFVVTYRQHKLILLIAVS
jgi:hypothetical protein